MTFSLHGSHYSLEATGQHVINEAMLLQARAELLVPSCYTRASRDG